MKKRLRDGAPLSSESEDSIEKRKRMTKEALLLCEEVEKHFRGKEREFMDFKVTMFDYLNNRIDDEKFASKINTLFKGNKDLISRFDSLMPDDYHILESIQINPRCYDDAKEFARNIMASFEDHEKTFKDLNTIFLNSKTARGVHQKVSVVFKDKPELLEQFVRFLPSRYVLEVSQSQPIAGDSLMVIEKNHLESDHARKSARVNHHREENGERIERSSTRKKLICKPVRELDLSKCESCTPSYRLLPKNYRIPPTSHETQLDDSEVLNNHCILASSQSENRSFKHPQKNEYEKALFHCEDDMYELDMLMESVKATAKRVEEIIETTEYTQTNETDGSFRVEDHLTVLNQRTIERLYGDEGLEMIDIVKQRPFRALPIILTRLKEKHEELTRCRHEFNKIWSRAIAENHRKLLDHQSKQQQRKRLSSNLTLDPSITGRT